MTYIVSGGALNSTNSLTLVDYFNAEPLSGVSLFLYSLSTEFLSNRDQFYDCVQSASHQSLFTGMQQICKMLAKRPKNQSKLLRLVKKFDKKRLLTEFLVPWSVWLLSGLHFFCKIWMLTEVRQKAKCPGKVMGLVFSGKINLFPAVISLIIELLAGELQLLVHFVLG